MARAQFRYTVQDQDGGVVQNCRVYLYKPGTSDDFEGKAFSAREGGGPVPNGFPTDEAGVVVAWLDTPQEFDVVVTDNGGTAYYPGKPGQPFSFDDIREEGWEVLPALDDLPFGRGREPEPGRTGGDVGVMPTYSPGDHGHPTFPGKVTPSVTKPWNLRATTAEAAVVSLEVPGTHVAPGSVFRIAAKMFVTTANPKQLLTVKLRWGSIVLGKPLSYRPTAMVGENLLVVEGLVTFRQTGVMGSAAGDLWTSQGGSYTADAVTVDTSVDQVLSLTAFWAAEDEQSDLHVDNAYIQQVV